MQTLADAARDAVPIVVGYVTLGLAAGMLLVAEGLAWGSTALTIGVSIGSLLAGQATDAGGSRAGYLAVAAFAWGAVVVGVLGLPALRRARTSGSLGGH